MARIWNTQHTVFTMTVAGHRLVFDARKRTVELGDGRQGRVWQGCVEVADDVAQAVAAVKHPHLEVEDLAPAVVETVETITPADAAALDVAPETKRKARKGA